MTTTEITHRITNWTQLSGKIVLSTDILLVVLAEGLGGVMLRGNDEAEVPPRGLYTEVPLTAGHFAVLGLNIRCDGFVLQQVTYEILNPVTQRFCSAVE